MFSRAAPPSQPSLVINISKETCYDYDYDKRSYTKSLDADVEYEHSHHDDHHLSDDDSDGTHYPSSWSGSSGSWIEGASQLLASILSNPLTYRLKQHRAFRLLLSIF